MPEAAKPVAAAPTRAESSVLVRAAHGLIIHPFTGQSFDTDGAKKVELDAWVKIQLEAGKLAKVE